MGKRSRRQQQTAAAAPEKPAKPPLRERASRASERVERQIKERPPAPWDPVPLAEIGIFIGMISMIVGALTHGDTGTAFIAAGFTLACLGGLDTVLREHLNGYRPHSGMLSGIVSLLALAITTAVFNIGLPIRLGIAIAVFGACFPALRRDYARRAHARKGS